MTSIASPVYTAAYRKLIREFPLRTIRTKAEAAAARKILDRIFRNDDGDSDKGEEAYADVLAGLLGDYEDRHDPVKSDATGLEVLRELMNQNNLVQSDIAKLFGISHAAVSMIMSGRRELTMDHARKLGARFGIDAGVFI